MEEAEFLKPFQKRAVKRFNAVLKGKDLVSVKKYEDGLWCLTFQNGQQNFVKGIVVNRSDIYEKDLR